MKTRTFWEGASATMLGAGLMALLDPQSGKRRRALLRDKTVHAAHRIEEAAGMTWRDLSHRASGALAGARRFAHDEPVSDEVLAERVRSKIGRLVTHPSSIEVTAAGGRVTLAGPVLSREHHRALCGVRAVRGVKEVEDRLEVHDRADRVPGLQGPGVIRGRRFELFQENWSPTTRLFAGAAGGGLAVLGARRRDWLGGVLAVAGSGVLLRAATNLPAKRLFGLAEARRGFDLRKTVTVRAPVEEVFALWSRFENLPRIFSHVREVRDQGKGCTHWKVQGPAGTVLEWDAVVTESIPNRVLAWKSAPGEAIRHAGLVRFEPLPADGTRLDIRMTYKPLGGVLAQSVAALFGADPKTALDEDMVRLQSLLEQGSTEAHGKEVTREEVVPAGEAQAAEGARTKPPPRRPAPARPEAGVVRKSPRPDA